MIRIEQQQIAAPRFRITSFDGKTPARFCRRSLGGVVRIQQDRGRKRHGLPTPLRQEWDGRHDCGAVHVYRGAQALDGPM